jgi:hypothetical protein
MRAARKCLGGFVPWFFRVLPVWSGSEGGLKLTDIFHLCRHLKHVKLGTQILWFTGKSWFKESEKSSNCAGLHAFVSKICRAMSPSRSYGSTSQGREKSRTQRLFAPGVFLIFTRVYGFLGFTVCCGLKLQAHLKVLTAWCRGSCFDQKERKFCSSV